MKNQKQTRKRLTQGRGATFIITEMAVFTPETDHSCETGYPFDYLRQVGNTSLSQNGIVLISNEQSACSLEMDYPFQIVCVEPPTPLRKNRRRVVCGGARGLYTGQSSTDNPFLARVCENGQYQNSRVQCL